MPDPLDRLIAEAFAGCAPQDLGVAVSGGSDSMALLCLLHDFCNAHDTVLRAVTVDHGLRAEAAGEAASVAAFCRTHGIAHTTLRWDDWDGQGNLQSAARKARYRLITQWAAAQGIKTVAIGHTADDQAETVLMNMARRSGVDGLSAMTRRMLNNGITWLRPLLGARREDLRAFLSVRNVAWAEDPSNEDTRFDRIKVRRAMGLLDDIGIDVTALTEVAANMADARKALEWQTFIAARELVEFDAGAIVMCARRFRILPEEIQRRLLVKAMNWITGHTYPPRRAAVATLMSALGRGLGSTLDGCHAQVVAGHIWIFRELRAVEDLRAAPDQLWDDRWHFEGAAPLGAQRPAQSDLSIAALGKDGLRQCPDWRASGRPNVVLRSTPAVWHGDRVVAAPLAGWPENWQARVDDGEETFFAALLSH
jgi:tRNA(Ile)-lysidine synthase